MYAVEALSRVAVRAESAAPERQRLAAEIAAELRLPLLGGSAENCEMLLAVTDKRIELRDARRRAHGPGPVYVDFVGGRLGYTRGLNRFGEIFQAVGLHRGARTVIDATAGLGQDAFLLATSGLHVTALERSPVVAMLLRDGLARAEQADARLGATLRSNLRLLVVDAREFLRKLPAEQAPEVVYLDPMFPPRRKSALVKKEMRLLRRVVGDDPDAAELLAIARGVARRHVVVKRMRLAPELAPDPVRRYEGKTTRFDIYAAGCHSRQ